MGEMADIVNSLMRSMEERDAEIERLRAELAAVKAEPPRPAAIVACPSKSARGYMVHQFEDFQDEDVMRVSRYLADEVSFPIHVFKVTDFIWHPKKST